MLQSVPEPRATTNPYLTQLFSGLSRQVEVVGFSWRAALLGSFDVFHVHWPETVMRSPGVARTWLRRLAFLTVLLGLRLRGTPVVRTAHNLEPHERAGLVERAALALCNRQTVFWIKLNAHTPTPDGCSRTIPHGHYRDWFDGRELPLPRAGRILFFGHIRRYKRVDSLLDAFYGCDEPGLSLRIVGSPLTPDLKDLVDAGCARDARCSAELGYVDDETLVGELGEAELVVLPYREMHNSGAALMALSLSRPVLVPRSNATEDLAHEVGEGWVHLYEGELAPHHLAAALAAGRGRKTSRPDLTRRGWDDAIDAHVRAYEEAVGRATRRPDGTAHTLTPSRRGGRVRRSA